MACVSCYASKDWRNFAETKSLLSPSVLHYPAICCNKSKAYCYDNR